MASWQAKVLNLFVKIRVRRRSWGDERALVTRARRIFGAPRAQQRLATRGLRVEAVSTDGVRGEWLRPEHESAGVILYVHGGGFVSCSPGTHRPIAGRLARLCGCPVFSVDYRLAPEHRWPAAVADAAAAYRWLLRRMAASQIALVGDSAGGGLVLSVLLEARDRGLAQPSCAVCFSPWVDLAGAGPSVQANDGRCVMFRTQNIRDFAHAYLGMDPLQVPEASPINANLRGLAPLLLQVGSTELLLDDARRLHEQISSNGGQSRIHVFDDVFHCWQMGYGILPEATLAMKEAASFIAMHRGREAWKPA
jgi:acetyl esterase/lipase